MLLRLALCFAVFLFHQPALCLAAETSRIIVDMRGKKVELPVPLTNIATLDDGFIEAILTHTGDIDSVKTIGSWAMKRDYLYSFPDSTGGNYEHRGWNTMKFLHPWLDDLVCVNSPQGNVINYEALAMSNPQAVILRVGDCTVGSGNKEVVEKTINTIEALGLPLVVLYAPAWYKEPGLATMKQEAAVVGAMFGKQEQTVAFMDWLEETEKLIRTRVASAPATEKPRVLYLGLNPSVRQQGGAGSVHGTNTPESYMLEEIVGASNAFRGAGSNVPMSAEQIYALDPDVILLPTANGYHPPRELYEAPYYETLQELRAVKEKRVYALPWSPMNCSRRVEYPLDMLIMAKAAYPKLFADINIYNFALEFYQKAYHVDEATAKGLRSTQLLDWMKESNF